MTIDIDQAEDQGVQPPHGDCDECGEPIPPGDPWTTNANGEPVCSRCADAPAAHLAAAINAEHVARRGQQYPCRVFVRVDEATDADLRQLAQEHGLATKQMGGVSTLARLILRDGVARLKAQRRRRPG